MAYYLPPSLDKLRSQIIKKYGIKKSSIGWIGDRAHQARASEHNPDADGSVDAIDVPHAPHLGIDMNILVSQLIASGDKRLQRVIWNRRIWDPKRGWRNYSGANPHTAHAHIETTNAGQSNASDWKIPAFGYGGSNKVADKNTTPAKKPTTTAPPPSTPSQTPTTTEEDEMQFLFSDGKKLWLTNGLIRREVPVNPDRIRELFFLGQAKNRKLDDQDWWDIPVVPDYLAGIPIERL